MAESKKKKKRAKRARRCKLARKAEYTLHKQVVKLEYAGDMNEEKGERESTKKKMERREDPDIREREETRERERARSIKKKGNTFGLAREPFNDDFDRLRL